MPTGDFPSVALGPDGRAAGAFPSVQTVAKALWQDEFARPRVHMLQRGYRHVRGIAGRAELSTFQLIVTQCGEIEMAYAGTEPGITQLDHPEVKFNTALPRPFRRHGEL